MTTGGIVTTNIIRGAAIGTAALLLAACNDGSNAPLQGYVEGTYVNVAPEAGGRIVEVAVARGATVKKGDLLFRLTDADQAADLGQAEARAAQAEAQLRNLKSGKRPAEIDVLKAQLASAEASLDAAEKEFTRASSLLESRVTSQATVDSARQARDVARAQVEAARKSLEVGQLPSRPEEITAAEANLTALKAAVEAVRVQLDKRRIFAPAAGVIEDRFFEPGEFVAAAQPVVSVLPADGRKIRFYLPETKRAGLKAGDRVSIGCDGCASGMTAEVTFVASQSEYTPPVIYSIGNREKLVFRVEARPSGGALPIGLPVDVRLQAKAGS